MRVSEGDGGVVPPLVHPADEPLRVGDRCRDIGVAAERPGSSERPDLPGDGERHRDLLALPRRDLAFRPGRRLDRDPGPPLDLEHAPELALRDEDRAGVHPPEDERLVERPDDAARDHIEDLHLALVVDHREVLDEVAPGPARPDDPGAVDPDQPVLGHLAADVVEERPETRKDVRPFDHLPDAGDLDLAVLDRDRRHLVREHVGSTGGRDDPFALVRLCSPRNHERFQEVVEPRCKDGSARYGVETVAGPADPLHQARDLRGEPNWTTCSMCPMSIPSSIEDVAISVRTSPFRNRSSAST